MGCRILTDAHEDKACFYDSVTGFAFGPTMEQEALEKFQDWLDVDPRRLSVVELGAKRDQFLKVWKFFEAGYCGKEIEAKVAALCLECVELNVKHDSQLHAYGSTTATEQLTELELVTDEVTVEIPADVRTLPDEFYATYTCEDGVDVRLLFHPHKKDGLPIVDVERGTVCYAVEIAD